ncbi:glycosyl transferase family 2 [Hypnocyclicus thermotrophus]|uniref:Glycosyl transferase family 2 n=1 Tax=Hypnocyclicus thermotrophus TaxID=1627895 RepID=A0AA46E079_9FUSO|nr:glycosyltransferase [Hypnocyclicus thermotrophus]TDT72439.1 glycosyl transferase family 2 [Hypnocyclicus thermotrophus]
MIQNSIDIVIIGLNAEKTIVRCLNSIEGVIKVNSDKKIKVYYVDGGSVDNTLLLVSRYKFVNILKFNKKNPTPGAQRNFGWQQGKGEYVQFIDSDTTLELSWFNEALNFIKKDDKIGAVCGKRVELYPYISFYNWIGNIEWNPKFGNVLEFGGDVFIKREVLEKTNGYKDSLIAGEDPELSYRIRNLGYKILKIDRVMTYHDLAMINFRQYLKRSFRSGYAFAEINYMYKDMWGQELKRILVRGGISLILFIIALLFVIIDYRITLFAILSSLLLLFRPRLFLVSKFMILYNLNKDEGKKYAWHVSLVVLPQFLGSIRFYLGKLLKKPLKNNKMRLSTGGIK